MKEQVAAPERRNGILDLIEQRGFARVGDLATAFDVSAVTVRGDLSALEAEGRVRRVHGGAVPASEPAQREPSFEESLEAAVDARQQIARTAAHLVTSGQSVILDVSATAHAIARALRTRDDLHDVTIVTNGLSIALELETAIPRFTVVVTGGTLRPLQHSLVDPLAEEILERLAVDIAFIGCNGVDAHGGVTNINLPEAAVKRRMLARAGRAFVIADAGKLGRTHLGVIGPLSAFDGLITDNGADAAQLAELAAAGLMSVVE